jgi:hypothetical protein
MKNKGNVAINVTWTAINEEPGIIELVKDGVVVASQSGIVKPGIPVELTSQVSFNASGWVCARRMDETGHVTHTAPLYISVNDKPIRASVEDARFFVAWIDNILQNTAPGGPWDKYFTTDKETVRKRYLKAREIYETIAKEAAAVR